MSDIETDTDSDCSVLTSCYSDSDSGAKSDTTESDPPEVTKKPIASETKTGSDKGKGQSVSSKKTTDNVSQETPGNVDDDGDDNDLDPNEDEEGEGEGDDDKVETEPEPDYDELARKAAPKTLQLRINSMSDADIVGIYNTHIYLYLVFTHTHTHTLSLCLCVCLFVCALTDTGYVPLNLKARAFRNPPLTLRG